MCLLPGVPPAPTITETSTTFPTTQPCESSPTIVRVCWKPMPWMMTTNRGLADAFVDAPDGVAATPSVAKPRFVVIIHGIGFQQTRTIVGDDSQGCVVGNVVDVSVTVGAGGTPGSRHNQLSAQAFCGQFHNAGPAEANDPGTGAFASAGPEAGSQTQGMPDCIGKYFKKSKPASTYLVVCRFY